jgi:phenylacetic acid degradation operon negative regulatory protein
MTKTSAPKPGNLVLKLLLAAHGEPLSAREAVASCALFGISENSVRVALVRLTEAELIEAAGRGAYRLGRKAATLAGEVATWRTAEKRVRQWQGGWIAAYVGALGRSDRVALRTRDRALSLMGMCELQRGLYVRPDNWAGGVSSVRARLYALGLDADAPVFLAREFDGPRDEAARRLWNGSGLTHGYRNTRHKLEQSLARLNALQPEVAAREAFVLGNAAIRRIVFDPLLPAPLVDVDERRALLQVVLRYDEVGHAIWRRLHASPVSPSRRRGALGRVQLST